jgi:hypothetical protein
LAQIKMRTIIITTILSFICSASFGQLELPNTVVKGFTCTSDSLSHIKTLELLNNDIDTFASFRYDYDNGRSENAITYILWIDQGIGFMNKFGGCDEIKSDTTYTLNISDLFIYFEENRIDTLTKPIETEISQSHDMGYYISIYLPELARSYNVRDYERMWEYENDDWEMFDHPDARVNWVNLFESKL